MPTRDAGHRRHRVRRRPPRARAARRRAWPCAAWPARRPSSTTGPGPTPVEVVAGRRHRRRSAGAGHGRRRRRLLPRARHGHGVTTSAPRDREAAATFRDAAARGRRGPARLPRAGSGATTPTLSEHLRSRHDVGATLADGPVPVTELRAAVVIGSGSASFEMLRHLTEVLPVMITPRWVRTRCQPIAIRDVLAYLVGVLGRPRPRGRVLEIGGPDVVTYAEMMDALRRGRRPATPGRDPGAGADAPPVVVLGRTGHAAAGGPGPAPHRQPGERGRGARPRHRGARAPHAACRCATPSTRRCERTRDLEVTTSWADAELAGAQPADPMPTDPDWSGGIVLDDCRDGRHRRAGRAGLRRPSTASAAERGWYVAEPFWDLRGFADRLARRPRHAAGPAPSRPACASVTPSTSSGSRPSCPIASCGCGPRCGCRAQAWLEWTMEPTGDRHPPGAAGPVPAARRVGAGVLVRPAADPPRDLPAPGRAPGRHRRACGCSSAAAS